MTQYTFDENTVSDLHKDAYGFRPKQDWWREWNLLDDAGKQELWDLLIEALKESNERENAREKEAIEDLEHRIEIMMSTIAGCTRKDAVRYLDDVYDTNGDINFLEYHLGVPYGYLTGIKPGFLGPVCV